MASRCILRILHTLSHNDSHYPLTGQDEESLKQLATFLPSYPETILCYA